MSTATVERRDKPCIVQSTIRDIARQHGKQLSRGAVDVLNEYIEGAMLRAVSNTNGFTRIRATDMALALKGVKAMYGLSAGRRRL